MAGANRFWPRQFFYLFFISSIPFSLSQSNIETFYPFPAPSPAPAPQPDNPIRPPSQPPQPLAVFPLPPAPPQDSSSGNTVAKAVGITAASTLVVAALFFFLLHTCAAARRRKKGDSGGSTAAVVPHEEFSRVDGNVRGFIVDENGLDVLYWRKLGGSINRKSFREGLQNSKDAKGVVTDGNREGKSEPIQEIPLLRGRSSTSHENVVERDDPSPTMAFASVPHSQSVVELQAIGKSEFFAQTSAPPPPPPPAVPSNKNPPPPPPPIPLKKNPAPPPPPPPKRGDPGSSLKPPPIPKGRSSHNKNGGSSSGEGMKGEENAQVKLKPLHWDKVNVHTDHSMVWDKIDRGSFSFDGDLMEALFGYVATNRKSPQRESRLLNPSTQTSAASGKVFILDSRKSQNTAIVLKSLSITREEILDALSEGQGLNLDTLERLARIAPTKDEQSLILEYDGDPARLADAESFLYGILKAIPSAFTRVNAMLFRSNYDSEIIHLKESLEILELGCKELRTRGLFVKLLEAVLKAGNRMNAGTARGNAQAFNLNALLKLSDVKSTDGKTTLLHFVVQEVVRSEGRRCVLNRDRSFSRSSSRSSNNGSNSEETAKNERERDYIMLGLPVVGGLSSEFSNVKKAASIDYDTFISKCAFLTARVSEIQKIVAECATDGGREGFAQEMRGFLESARRELEVLKGEEVRVIGLVKRTTEYYQAGATKVTRARPLELFYIIKDFLGMVDQACVELARNLQRRKTTASFGSSSPESPLSRNPVKFPNLPANFFSENRPGSSSSDT